MKKVIVLLALVLFTFYFYGQKVQTFNDIEVVKYDEPNTMPELTSTYWTATAGWTINDATKKATHTTGTTTLYPTASIGLVAGSTYKLAYAISGLTTGTITVDKGGVASVTRSANGSYTDSFTASTTASLTFTPSTACDAVISLVTLRKTSGGNLDCEGALNVDGNTTIGGSATITGAVTLTAGLAGDITLSNGEKISNATDGTVDIDGHFKTGRKKTIYWDGTTSLLTLYNSITDADSEKVYDIIIPAGQGGVFDMASLTLKPYVNLIGAGGKDIRTVMSFSGDGLKISTANLLAGNNRITISGIRFNNTKIRLENLTGGTASTLTVFLRDCYMTTSSYLQVSGQSFANRSRCNVHLFDCWHQNNTQSQSAFIYCKLYVWGGEFHMLNYLDSDVFMEGVRLKSDQMACIGAANNYRSLEACSGGGGLGMSVIYHNCGEERYGGEAGVSLFHHLLANWACGVTAQVNGIIKGTGVPHGDVGLEGSAYYEKGTQYLDTTNNALYIKDGVAGTDTWTLNRSTVVKFWDAKSSLITLYNSITDATSEKVYNIIIPPGQGGYYDMATLALKPFVNLIGAGGKDIQTVMSFSGDGLTLSTAGLIAGNCRITVQGIRFNNTKIRLENLTGGTASTVTVHFKDCYFPSHAYLQVSGESFAYRSRMNIHLFDCWHQNNSQAQSAFIFCKLYVWGGEFHMLNYLDSDVFMEGVRLKSDQMACIGAANNYRGLEACAGGGGLGMTAIYHNCGEERYGGQTGVSLFHHLLANWACGVTAQVNGIIKGNGVPTGDVGLEGSAYYEMGTQYIDTANGTFYIKTANSGTDTWVDQK